MSIQDLELFKVRDNPAPGKAGWRALGDPKGEASAWLGAYVSALDATGNPPCLVEVPTTGKGRHKAGGFYVVVGCDDWVFCVQVNDHETARAIVGNLAAFLGRTSVAAVPALTEGEFMGGQYLSGAHVETREILGLPRKKVKEWIEFTEGPAFKRDALDLVTRGAGLGDAGALCAATSALGAEVFLWPASSPDPMRAPWFCAFNHSMPGTPGEGGEE